MLLGVWLLACLVVAWRVVSQHRMERHSLQVAITLASEAAEVVEQRLARLAVAGEIAREVTERELTDAQIEDLLAKRLGENDAVGVLGAGFADGPHPPRVISWTRADSVTHEVLPKTVARKMHLRRLPWAAW